MSALWKSIGGECGDGFLTSVNALAGQNALSNAGRATAPVMVAALAVVAFILTTVT